MKRIAAWSLAAGVWALAWILACLSYYVSLGGAASNAALDITALFPTLIARMLRVSPSSAVSILGGTAFLLVSLCSAALLWVNGRLDQGRISTRALRWTIRSSRCAWRWMACFAALALCGAIGLLRFGSWLSLVPAVAFYLTLPFFCLRRDVIAASCPVVVSKPHWPGSLAVALLAASTLVPEAVSWLAAVPALSAGPGMWLVDVASLAVDVMLTTVALGAWSTHARWPDVAGLARTWLHRQYLLPMLGMQCLLLWITVFAFGPPLLLGALHMIYVEPEIADTWKHVAPPVSVQLVTWVEQWLIAYGWLVVAAPFAWFMLTAEARTLHLSQGRGVPPRTDDVSIH